MAARLGRTARGPWRTAGAALLAGTAAAFVAAGHHARHRAPYEPRLELVAVPTPCSHDLAGLRIGFLTDTHVGPMVDAGLVARALDLLVAAEPDVLCLGGDVVCDSPRFIPDAAAVLGEYVAAARLGTYAVLGNHDYSTDAARLTAALERKGIRVLRNEAVPVAGEDASFWIVGIDDALLGRPDLDRAFAAVPPDSPVVTLWHEPDWAEQTAQHGALLQLSGHSHGGQIRLPFVGHLSAPTGGKRFAYGLNYADCMPVYTSRGLGVFHPPVRFRCPPEVTLLTLVPRAVDRLASDASACHAAARENATTGMMP
jgi:predicted MPP superfamily phosphohydrolase